MFSLWKKQEQLVGIDIGAAAIKVIELELGRSGARLRRAELWPLKGDVFSNNSITKPDRVVGELLRLCDNVPPPRAVTAVPAPSVFVKKFTVPKSGGAALAANVQLEASNLIPHKLDAVRLDYQVLGMSGANLMEVLLVAVKGDVLDSFTGCLNGAGIETAIVDVDLFALQNAFEFTHPERAQSTVALVNIGARYTGVNICRGGRSLSSGDMAIGGRGCTEALMHHLGVGFDEAEQRKIRCDHDEKRAEIHEVLGRWVDNAALEINRQLGLLWGGVAADGRIDSVIVSGGGSLVPGCLEALSRRTELPCERLDPFRGLEPGDISGPGGELAASASMGVAVGLALRRLGDKSTAGLAV